MNLPQRIILVVAFAALLIMAIFPPWVFVHEVRGRRVERAAGYHPLFSENHPQDRDRLAAIFGLDAHEYEAQPRFFAMRLDGMRLTLQLSVTILLTLISFFLLKNQLRSHT